MATRAAAPPPTALNSDTSCGIAVIFTVRAVYRPAPAADQEADDDDDQRGRAEAAFDGCQEDQMKVATTATTMPPALSWLPFRAVAGEFIR